MNTTALVLLYGSQLLTAPIALSAIPGGNPALVKRYRPAAATKKRMKIEHNGKGEKTDFLRFVEKAEEMLRRELWFQVLVSTIERRPASSPFWIEQRYRKDSLAGRQLGGARVSTTRKI